MKYLIGAMAIAVGLFIFCGIRFSCLIAGAIGAVMVHGLFTLWSFGCE